MGLHLAVVTPKLAPGQRREQVKCPVGSVSSGHMAQSPDPGHSQGEHLGVWVTGSNVLPSPQAGLHQGRALLPGHMPARCCSHRQSWAPVLLLPSSAAVRGAPNAHSSGRPKAQQRRSNQDGRRRPTRRCVWGPQPGDAETSQAELGSLGEGPQGGQKAGDTPTSARAHAPVKWGKTPNVTYALALEGAGV